MRKEIISERFWNNMLFNIKEKNKTQTSYHIPSIKGIVVYHFIPNILSELIFR